MLFNSIPFIGIFLPITLAVTFLLAARVSSRAAVGWLAFASVVFYGYWRIQDVPILLGSVAANYLIGRELQLRPSRLLLAIGVGANLLLLGYFKYLVFLTLTANVALGDPFTVPQIVLPLGISFFTFQKIAYLVDSHGGVVKQRHPLDYLFFVSFFPQLIAGPITHHAEITPQLRKPGALRFNVDDFAIGLTVFAIGLAKKVVIADRLAPIADDVFDGAAAGETLTMFDAWGGALAYALQIYFDFSGYSDMAIGLGRMVGIRLPINFASPYKAGSIIEFWSRWHVTLTRFLTSYVYNPLSLRAARTRAELGKPPLRRGRAASAGAFLQLLAIPTIVTMLLSGIWHGAGFQFILWGALHGIFLAINQAWRLMVLPRLPWRLPKLVSRPLSVLFTFSLVVMALVFFRSQSVGHGWDVLTAMLGTNGILLPPGLAAKLSPLSVLLPIQAGHTDFLTPNVVVSLVGLLAAVWFLPNTQEIMARRGIALSPGQEVEYAKTSRFGAPLRLSPALGFAVGAIGSLALLYTASVAPTKFIYFNF
jgi:alginate O-acetyltransferase complex protein AlgI